MLTCLADKTENAINSEKADKIHSSKLLLVPMSFLTLPSLIEIRGFIWWNAFIVHYLDHKIKMCVRAGAHTRPLQKGTECLIWSLCHCVTASLKQWKSCYGNKSKYFFLLLRESKVLIRQPFQRQTPMLNVTLGCLTVFHVNSGSAELRHGANRSYMLCYPTYWSIWTGWGQGPLPPHPCAPPPPQERNCLKFIRRHLLSGSRRQGCAPWNWSQCHALVVLNE